MARKKFGLSLETNRSGADTTAPIHSNTESKIAEINNPAATDPFGYKLVPFHKIKRNEKNDYEMVNLTSLKESILRGELLHNFDVKYDFENDYYTLISGERRFTSLALLREEFEDDMSSADEERLHLYNKNVKPFFTMGVPCKILNRNKELDEIDELILLNEANLEVRELSPAKKAAKISELQELYRRRNERDGKTVSVQKQVADTLQISTRQVQQYTAINEKLIPELKEEFDNNKITVKDGSAFAQLDEESQKNILEIIKKNGKVNDSELLALKEERALKEKRISELEKELEEKNSKLTDAEEKAATVIEKNNELILSLNKSREDFAKKEELLRQSLEEEIKSNNQDNLTNLQKELAKIQEDKKSLEKHISDIEQETLSKENELQQLRKELDEQKNSVSQKQEPVLSEEEKTLLKYNYELSKNVDEIKSLISNAKKVIEAAGKLNITLSDDFNNNALFISNLTLK